jgi:hypothetical protein
MKEAITRGELVRRAGAGAALASVGGLVLAEPAHAVEITGEFKDEGAGIYTDSSVANQLSSFTINRCVVTCGVGTIAPAVPGGPPEDSGPFAMLMISTNVKNYHVDRATQTITADGRMRSITRVGGSTVEDVEHDFLAIAVDTGDAKMDRFDVHFTTPFWSPTGPGALFCTPSTVHPGWCRFGGILIRDPSRGDEQLGDVAVTPPPPP